MLRQPLNAELAAAIAVAARAGLGLVRTELLHLGNHTSVRLQPWPIVARIASGTSFDFSHESLVRELAIARHLALGGAPAIRPANDIGPGPYLEGDCAITLWQFVEGRPISNDGEDLLAAASLKRVHAALADVGVDLPSFTTKVESCEAILANPAEAPKLPPTDRLFLERLYVSLREQLDEIEAASQPLHGDTHLGNVLISPTGAIWMDLEAACNGPLAWDVVNLPPATWSEFGPVDADLMRLLADVRSLCLAVWCWAEFDRSAASAEAAIYLLAQLKVRFDRAPV